MPQYLLEVSHTEEDCLRALDQIVVYSTQILNHISYGCVAGVHTGWVNVEADSESEARNVLPPTQRRKARVVEVQKFTPEQIKALHKK